MLVVVLIASAAVLGWLLVDRRGEASDAQAEREAVMSQTEQFVLRLNTYGPDQLDAEGHLTEYQQQVAEVITPKFATDFETEGLPIAESDRRRRRLRRAPPRCSASASSPSTATRRP